MVLFKKKPDLASDISSILNPIVKKWFFSRFKEFSTPQLYGIKEIASRKNVLISSPTGSTKTLTAFLSILNELVDSSIKGKLEDKIYCIYVSPLKSLNYDIEVNLKTPLSEIEKIFGKELGIRIGVRTGDTTQKEKNFMRKNPPHILITTPESLAIIASSKSFGKFNSGVEWIILDEIHAICSGKRGSHLALTLEYLQRKSGYISRVGLSATVSPIEEVAKFLCGFDIDSVGKSLERECVVIDVSFIKKTDISVISPVDNFLSVEYNFLENAIYSKINELIKKHKSTLVFTNTRAATERLVDQLKFRYSKEYNDNNIAAHHSSLSKNIRKQVESDLREGKLRCVVSSTSLELGIDIGYIDLVILLSSPKSVSRALQRCGRSGHRLKDTTKGRVIATNRDDLLECSVLISDALKGHIDNVHIPKGALDVLAQQILYFVLCEPMKKEEIYYLCKRSYPFSRLEYKEFNSVIEYLLGDFERAEQVRIYPRIRIDSGGFLRPKGKMSRVIYHTNLGTIPQDARVSVKQGESIIGYIDEPFLEMLSKGDIFVLGGSSYMFLYSKGMTAQVLSTPSRPPTIPQWYSEMLPLSFELAMDICYFNEEVRELLKEKKDDENIVSFIEKRLSIDHPTSRAIFSYLKEQFEFVDIPSHKRIIIERYKNEEKHYVIYHTRFGRRVNDVLSRVCAYVLSIENKSALDISVNDYGFCISSKKKISKTNPFGKIKLENFKEIAIKSIEKSEILRRRFRHCAARAFMILRSYKSNLRSVGRQQVSSQILLNAVRGISDEFPILKEAKREVLEDLMDVNNLGVIIRGIEDKEIQIVEKNPSVPSPFSFNLISQYASDSITAEDRHSFMMRLNKLALAKISLDKGKKILPKENLTKGNPDKEPLKYEFQRIALSVSLNKNIMLEIMDSFDGSNVELSPFTINWIKQVLITKEKVWPSFVIKHLHTLIRENK